MSSTLCSWSSALVVLALLCAAAHADDDFSYFSNPEIDYWRRSSTTQPTAKRQPEVAKAPAASGGKPFAWEKYLNPGHDEFFKEGEYSPPAPFVEIARNPSDENIDRWYQYIQTKNDVLRRLQTKLAEYAQRHPGNVAALPAPYSSGLAENPEALSRLAAKVETPPATPPDAKRFRLRLYFDSHCPHCERMMGTMNELAGLGYYVELRQVDRDRSTRAKIPFPVTDATPEELKTYGVQAVPVLLVGDLRRKSYFKIDGFHPTSAVVAALPSK
jgi:glutaredoxin